MSSFNTCFFERYAHGTLWRCLGNDYYDLVNRDRPDLQSPDGKTMGIEVTRAMEESKEAADKLLTDMSGICHMEYNPSDLEQMLLSGYGYGLETGKVIGSQEVLYWSMALPMKRILENKISKVTGGFYGQFDMMGLYIFCKDPIGDADVMGICKRAMEIQAFQETRYDYLYLSEVNELHVCSLKEDISDEFRVSSFRIPIEMRKEIYGEAMRSPGQARG